jgi:3,4-dihydroxy 2-butanone 4-phosphate synthase/GTP cyclohydrolase II
VHVADPLRDLLRAQKKDASGWSLPKALRYLAEHEDPGVILLLGDSFSGHPVEDLLDGFYGVKARPRAVLKDGTSVYRSIGTGSQILQELGIHKMRLLSSPMRFNAISGFSLEIVEYIGSENADE